MRTKSILSLCVLVLLAACSSAVNESSYLTDDLLKDVSKEQRGEPPLPAWGNSWVRHWEDLYARLVQNTPDVATSIVQRVEGERRRRGLPPADMPKCISDGR